MSTRIKVECMPDETLSFSIRALFCHESGQTKDKDRNPLIETNFNHLLAEITQRAFDEGRCFEREHKGLSANISGEGRAT